MGAEGRGRRFSKIPIIDWALVPFRWDEERWARIRAKLDAIYAHLYGLGREATPPPDRYILALLDVIVPKVVERPHTASGLFSPSPGISAKKRAPRARAAGSRRSP